ncbi:MAG: ATP-binding protein [Pseudomonadota bacterium]
MKKGKQQFKAGMYLLETLTAGMYNEPLSIYREYIQNCVDSIDLARQAGQDDFEIRITLDPFEKVVLIHDNGAGIPASHAERVLSSIGSSDKIGTDQRGFRGIGRLGGIAFAQRVTFRTKAAGEKKISEQIWDCEKLRQLLSDPAKSPLSLEEMFQQVTAFNGLNSDVPENDSFFEVRLDGVESYRNQIFDIMRIKKYLSQVAPLPFDPESFDPFGNEITKYLYENVNKYGEYYVTINGTPVYRPYKKEFRVTNKGINDCIEEIEFVELKVNGKITAKGWLGKRRGFLGSISKGEGIAGIRVKVGNIMIGNEHLLDQFFREERFNSYTVGEIHIVSSDLVPNSRRDDFVDTPTKNLFFNAIEREIGLPVSKEIRLRSKLKSLTKIQNKSDFKSGQDSEFAKIRNGNAECCLENDSEIKLVTGGKDDRHNLFLKMAHRCREKKCPIYQEMISVTNC